MKRKVHRNRSVKFTGKKFSKKGLVAVIAGIAAIAAMIVVTNLSFQARGQADVYIGSIGLASMACAIFSMIIAIIGLREEDVYKALPGVGLGIGILSTAGWIAIYMGGMIG